MTNRKLSTRTRRLRKRAAGLFVAAVTATSLATFSAAPAGAIVGGRNADTNVVTGASANIVLGNMNCTATHIAPEWLITAKHCVGKGDRSSISLGGGRLGESRYAKEVVMHPDADLALIKLNQASDGPVAHISGQQLTTGTNTNSIGWGGASYNPFLTIQQADTQVQRRVFNIDPDNRKAQLIEVWVRGGRLTQGDSGGPLFIGDNLVGVASLSNGNQQPTINGTIGWYVPVADYTDWINRQTGIPTPARIGEPAPLVDAAAYPAVPPSGLAPAVGSSAIDSFLNVLPFRL